MKKPMMAFILAMAFIAAGCSKDEIADPINQVGASKEYELSPVGNTDISGTATFIRNEDNTTTVDIELEGTATGEMYPVHIHLNSILETGDIALTLNPVDGETGSSRTTVSGLGDGTPISYTDLLVFDGYIDVHLSADKPETVVAQADIGQNELTGESRTYDLGEVKISGITGTATFEKRKGGETLVTLKIAPTSAGATHAAHIHFNTAVETGAIAFTLNPINGATGKSITNIATLDDGTSITFQDLMNFDGYIDVHLSTEQSETIAQSDIGQNELTGETTTYTLDAVSNPGITGNAVFAERLNGETLVTLILEGTAVGNVHPAHIHIGSVEMAPEEIAISLNQVNGTTGKSMTNVVAFDAGGTINYDGLIAYDGYIDVHQSATNLETLIAQGNIGANTTD